MIKLNEEEKINSSNFEKVYIYDKNKPKIEFLQKKKKKIS